ncbi:hypothetical protein E2C01_094467 [Portunus trituberculatus]|uniref:Uncharacterized protein n=1 Tax=Portunus trituberculatus TaxID=210409 RepID=A0A5B7JSI1_PORTR|nr:hypothetical protein [Portunus trituberculatus]
MPPSSRQHSTLEISTVTTFTAIPTSPRPSTTTAGHNTHYLSSTNGHEKMVLKSHVSLRLSEM